MGDNPRTVRRWEVGNARPPQSVRDKLAKLPVPWMAAKDPTQLKLFVEKNPRHVQFNRLDCVTAFVSEVAQKDQTTDLGRSLVRRRDLEILAPVVLDAISQHGC